MFKYFIVVCKVIFPLIGSYFGWMIRYSKNPSKYDYKKRFVKVQKLIRRVLKAFKVKIKEEDIKAFNKRDYDKSRLLISNHLSDLDPLIYIAISEKPLTFVAKLESLKFPLIGRCIKILEGEFLDRDDLKQSLKVMMNVQRRLESDDRFDIMIFPEGTRNKVDYFTPLMYHHGTFRCGVKSNSPIDCFVIYGDQKVLSYKDNSFKFNVEITKSLSFFEKDFKEKTTNILAKEAEDDAKRILNDIKTRVSAS